MTNNARKYMHVYHAREFLLGSGRYLNAYCTFSCADKAGMRRLQVVVHSSLSIVSNTQIKSRGVKLNQSGLPKVRPGSGL